MIKMFINIFLLLLLLKAVGSANAQGAKFESVQANLNISPLMVYIPGGNVSIGTGANDKNPDGLSHLIGVDAMPRYMVHLDSFYMDKYEVTIGEYKEYSRINNIDIPEYWISLPYPLELDDELPAFSVTWNNASDYCRWAGKRLPTEAEWEYAARGDEGFLWPWGNTFNRNYLNIENQHRTNWIKPVGSYPENVSPFGVYDMAGNVMEWTSSWYKLYPGSKLGKRRVEGNIKVLRGGAWTSLFWMADTVNRFAADPLYNQPDFGFRCAKDR